MLDDASVAKAAQIKSEVPLQTTDHQYRPSKRPARNERLHFSPSYTDCMLCADNAQAILRDGDRLAICNLPPAMELESLDGAGFVCSQKQGDIYLTADIPKKTFGTHSYLVGEIANMVGAQSAVVTFLRSAED